MKSIRNMNQVELAAYVQSHLQKEKINVVLSGGSKEREFETFKKTLGG